MDVVSLSMGPGLFAPTASRREEDHVHAQHGGNPFSIEGGGEGKYYKITAQ